MVAILIMSVKLAPAGFPKMKVFWNKRYDIIISVYGITNKVSNLIADLVKWPKLGNSTISLRKLIIASILWGLDQKNQFFERWSRLMYNNLELALGVVLKFYIIMAKRLKVNVRKFWWLIHTFAEVTGKNW